MDQQEFNKTYPAMDRLRIEVRIVGSGGKEVKTKRFSGADLPAADIACGHQKCRGGGLRLDQVLSAIAALYDNRAQESTDYLLCRGGRYRGTKRYGPCGWAFRLLLSADYKA